MNNIITKFTRRKAYEELQSEMSAQELTVINAVRAGHNTFYLICKKYGLHESSVKRALSDLSRETVKGASGPVHNFRKILEAVRTETNPATGKTITVYRVLNEAEYNIFHGLQFKQEAFNF